MNRALRRVSLICLVLFVALLVNINWVQGFDASSLANEPGNGRTVSSTLQFQRGSIVTADQQIIAYSKMNKNFGEYQRHYPGGPIYAPVTGYDTLFSQTGIEGAENKELAGTDPALEVHNLIDLISGKKKKGATVTVTVNSAAQEAAYAGLERSLLRLRLRSMLSTTDLSEKTSRPSGFTPSSGARRFLSASPQEVQT